MKIKKFIASNIQEGTELIKKELGEEAIILSNRPTKTKNGMDAIEIVAGLDNDNKIVEKNNKVAEISKINNPNQLLNSLDNTINQKLIAEVNSLKNMIADISDNIKYKYTGTMPDALARVYRIMKDSDINEDMCLDIIGKIAAKGLNNDYNSSIAEARKIILSNIKFNNTINTNNQNKQIITFIGSSGCGKTTALIKLAIGMKILNQAKVLIISTDTFRVGAAEQLQLLTGIAGINFIITYNNDELKKVLNEETKYDMILIDTMGRNPNNRDEINDLIEMQNTINTMQTPFIQCKTNLVLSATSSISSLNNNIKKFNDCDINSVIITRLDEAFGLGNIITALYKTNIPISYFTNGQRIPDDIEQANSERLNEYLFVI